MWLFLGSYQYWAGMVYGVCVCAGVCVCVCYREHPKAQPTVVLDKPEIESATPGLQGMWFIHYTTAASA